MRKLDVTHISPRGSSYRITLPLKVVKKLGLNPDGIVAFGEHDGEVVVRDYGGRLAKF